MSAEEGAVTATDNDAAKSEWSVPALGQGFSPTMQSASSGTAPEQSAEGAREVDVDPKTGRRRFWNFGKKKDDEKAKKRRDAEQAQPGGSTVPISPIRSTKMVPASPKPQFASHPYGSPSSPGRMPQSASPHIPSPASSQIFERNVQDEIPLAVAASPAIPGHVATENHIPPVLDASTEAITDGHLDPDHVEIVMHAAHQPAAVTVTGSEPVAAAAPEESPPRIEPEEPVPAHGALDANDVRRLSFISFADVVQADKAADHSAMSDSGVGTFSGTSSVAQLALHNRSPSPIRSPFASQALSGTSPTSEPGSFKGLEGAHAQANQSGSPPGAALTVETMRQALRKTESGDLSGARSNPVSAVPGDEASMEHSLK